MLQSLFIMIQILKNLTQPMCIARVDTISRHFQGPESMDFINIYKESVSIG